MPTIGAPLHPQALFIGFDKDDPAFIDMSKLVASAAIVTSPDYLERDFRLVEWDLVVASGSTSILRFLPGHLHVLAMNGSPSGRLRLQEMGRVAEFAPDGRQPSSTIHVDEGLSGELKALVVTEFIPWLQRQPALPYITEIATWTAGPRTTADTRTLVGDVWVRDADDHPIAGAFPRFSESDGAGECWILPFLPDDPSRWLRAAISRWRDITPDRFSSLPAWTEDERWLTPLEMKLRGDLAALEAHRLEVMLELDKQQEAARSTLSQAAEGVGTDRRRLLSTQGDELVTAVAQSLSLLGFEVSDSDSQVAPGQGRTEDLQLRDPDAPEWTNITEVKGYAGGGKTRDLLELARYADIYRLRHGDQPASRWYVVNQFMKQDPGSRPVLMAGADEDLEVFAESGGLAIDTRDLFDLVKRAELGQLNAAEARRELRAASGRFTPNP